MPTLKRYNVEALNRYPWPAVTATIQRCNDVTKNNVLLTIAQRTLEAVCQEANLHRFPDVSAGAERHHSGLSFHEWTAREHDADAGGQWLSGAGIHLGVDCGDVHAAAHRLYVAPALCETGRGNHSGGVVRFREFHHAKHSLLSRFTALVSHLSPQHLAVHVRAADSL